MKIHKINLENYYRNAVDSAIAKINNLPEAIFAGRPTYNEAALKFAAGETPVLALPQWAQFTVDLTQDKPSWAPASGTLKATFSASVSGVEEGDEMDLDSEKVYGASVTATAKQFTVGEGKYTVVIQANILNGDDEVVLSYTSQAMKVAMIKEADNGPDTTLDVGGSGGTFTQEQSDWSQSDDTKVDFIKNKPTIPTVNNATLTLKQGDTTLGTFTANASTDVEVSIPSGGGDLLVEKTWSELKAMRDGGTLVPGQQYRITDYVATCADIAGNVSANHPFDIIVTADSESKLNEQARAIQHAGDTYFANSKLDVWRVWYCLDNDTTRFDWADTTNGKGVIYRMIDEWYNDLPFDFKGILITRRISGSLRYQYILGEPVSSSASTTDKSLGGQCTHNVIEPYGSTPLRIGYRYLERECNYITIRGNITNNISVAMRGNNITIGAGCEKIYLGVSATNISIGTGCSLIYFNSTQSESGLKEGYKNIEIGNDVKYINLNCTGNPNSSNPYQNVKICSGVAGTFVSPLTIADSNTNQAYQTTFFNETDGTLKKQEGTTITTVA